MLIENSVMLFKVMNCHIMSTENKMQVNDKIQN